MVGALSSAARIPLPAATRERATDPSACAGMRPPPNGIVPFDSSRDPRVSSPSSCCRIPGTLPPRLELTGRYASLEAIRIALVNTNRIQPPIAPIGLDYVAEALAASGQGGEILHPAPGGGWERAG